MYLQFQELDWKMQSSVGVGWYVRVQEVETWYGMENKAAFACAQHYCGCLISKQQFQRLELHF